MVGSVSENVTLALQEVYEDVNEIGAVEDAISFIYIDPPDVILVAESHLHGDDGEMIREFRGNTVYRNLPIIAVVSEGGELEWDDVPIDDFIDSGSPVAVISQRLRFISIRSVREMDTNPLTRLPGNESIIRYVQRMLDAQEDVALAWIDLDNFKPFNDCYGFTRGDEVLLATARIVANAVKELKQRPSFVGHVGGDDFIFICPVEAVKRLCEEIILRFDMVIKNFYNEEDLEKGQISSTDRGGNVKEFAIMTISIAVVMSSGRQGEVRYRHYGEISQDASGIKSCLKKMDGSNYMIDRRGKI